MKEYQEMFKRTFDYRGKSNRRDYWMCVLMNFIFGYVVFLIGLPFIRDWNLFVTVGESLSSLYDVIVFLPMLSLTVRRLHDVGRNAWYLLLVFLPVFGWFILLYLLAMPSSFSVNPWYSGYKDNKDSFSGEGNLNMNDLKHGFTEREDANTTSKVDQKQEEANDIKASNDNDKEDKGPNIKEDGQEMNKDKTKKDNETIVVDEARVKITDGAYSRSEAIEKLQKDYADGKITKEEYHSKLLNILSK